MKPHLCPFCRLGFIDILQHIGNCPPAVVQLSEEPDMIRMRTEHPDVLVAESIEQVKAMYAKVNRALTAEQIEFLRQNGLKNLRYLRGGA